MNQHPTQSTTNPYPRRPGFAHRLRQATQAIEKLGADPSSDIYTRNFDSCFEMYDGDAVVWALMHQAKHNPEGLLMCGIKYMDRTGTMLQHWMNIYTAKRSCLI